MLEIQCASKNYDGFNAVIDLDLKVPEGEFFCFLGPNGAGKTTTIKMITGLLKPSKGRLLIDGIDNQTNPIEAKKRIGYIPDTPYLYEKLTGREFLKFIGNLYHVPQAQQNAAFERYFDLFGLMSSADKLIENYSHGMRQKLCFCVQLMHRPKLLVIDEPMVGLDPRSGRTLKNLLKEFCREGGTIFLSTHLLYIAEELADRLGIITHGRLQFLGNTAALQTQLARQANLEDLFLELTEDGCTVNPELASPSPPAIQPMEASG